MSLQLTINGIVIPHAAAVRITQTYEDFGGFSTLRLGNGAAISQSTWQKIRTTISADGRMSPGLSAIDWRLPVTIGCVRHRSIQSESRVIAIPAARRIDVAPFAFATTAAGPQRAAVTISGNNATVALTPGAIAYAVHYFPLLTAFSDGPQESGEANSNRASWSLTAEEV